MRLTAGQLNRATLARQLLLQRERLDVVEAVGRVVALQAQEAASPYLALWNRVAGFDPTDLDAAFADHRVIKASLMRITLHAVTAGDYPTFHAAMVRALRGARLWDDRFTSTGLSAEEVDAVLPDLLAFMQSGRSKADIEGWLTDRLGRNEPRVWWAIRTFAALMHAPTGGPWSFGPRPAFVPARVEDPPAPREAAIPQLVRRYLEGFGPASVPDIAQFTLIARSVIREAVTALGDEVVGVEGPDRSQLFDVPGAVLPPEATPAPPRLLPMWDSIVLAYSDRSRVVPPDLRRIVTRQNGDTLPTLLVDGHVAGVWRPTEGGIEATAFHRLSDAAWEGLESEARALVAFLAARDPAVYRRYNHWWAHLPSAEVRVLGST